MSLPDKAFPVSWDQFHRDARALAWRIAGLDREWRAIVAITRGGLVPAAIICRELGIRFIETVCIASYHDYTSQGEMQVLKGIGASLLENQGEGVIVVDDLTDTGKTAAIVREMMPRAHFATVYAKPKGRPLIDTLRHGGLTGYLDLFPMGYGLHLSGADCWRKTRLNETK